MDKHLNKKYWIYYLPLIFSNRQNILLNLFSDLTKTPIIVWFKNILIVKKTTIIILITLISFKSNAQETLYEVWPDNSPELLIGKIVTPRPITGTLQRYGYEDFYKLKKKKWVGYDDSRSKWEKEQGKVKYELILGRKFKVDTFEQYEDGLLSKKLYWLYMTDVETGQKVRHSYDPNYEHSFQLSMTEEMIYPEGWFCKDFEIEKDKFNGETRIRTPYGSTITFLKYINGDVETYYLQLRKNGSTLNTGEKGVYII